jgi:ornithine decarboxylase
LPVASPFNGFPVPKVHVVADQSIWYVCHISTNMCMHA